jgi:hypothetical protein
MNRYQIPGTPAGAGAAVPAAPPGRPMSCAHLSEMEPGTGAVATDRKEDDLNAASKYKLTGASVI